MHEFCTIRLPTYDQYIFVRKNPDKPVLIWFSGGPGVPAGINLPYPAPLSELYHHFTLVHWDAPGVGKSFFSQTKISTIMDLLTCADEVVEYAKTHYSKQIIAFGESFGSYVAFEYARTRPDNFKALVTSGQVSDILKSEELSRDYIIRNHDDGWRKKLMLHQYSQNNLLPYYMLKIMLLKTNHGYFGQNGPVTSAFDIQRHLRTPYSLTDYAFAVHPFKLLLSIQDDLMKGDLFQTPYLPVPWTTMIGTYDYMVPWELSRHFYQSVSAPSKKLITLEGAGHEHFRERPRELVDILISAANSVL